MKQGMTTLLRCDKAKVDRSGTIEMTIDDCPVSICFTGEETRATQEKITDTLLACYRDRVKKWME